MKRKFSFALIAVLVVILVLSTVLVACKKETEDGTQVTLTSIRISSASLELEQGATLDSLKTLITVTAVYSDGSEDVITDFTLEGFDPSLVGQTQTVTITYLGQTQTISVSVKENGEVTPVEPVELVISLKVNDALTSFQKGENDVYTLTVNLKEGDVISVVDNKDNTYSIELEGFNGAIAENGEYTFTISAGGVNVSFKPEEVEPTPEVGYVLVVNQTEKVDFVLGDDGVYNIAKSLEEGDQVKVVDKQGNVIAFQDQNFGTIVLNGEYTFTLDPSKPALLVEVDAPEAPVVEEGYYLVVNNQKTKMTLNTQSDSEEYYSSVTLSANDSVYVEDAQGNAYQKFENAEEFNGTVTIEGEYTFYFKVEGSVIYAVVPVVITDDDYLLVINDDDTSVFGENPENENELVASCYLEENDQVKFLTPEGREITSFENPNVFQGVAKADGIYTFYLKIGETIVIYTDAPNADDVIMLYFKNRSNDGIWREVYAYAWDANGSGCLGEWPGVKLDPEPEYEDDGWFNVAVSVSMIGIKFHDNQDLSTPDLTIDADKPFYRDGDWYATREDEPAIQHTYFITVNDGDPITMAYNEGDFGAQYVYSTELKADDSVVFTDEEGNAYSNYTDTNFDGQVIVDGTYSFYLKLEDGNPIYVDFQEITVESFAVYVNDQKIADMSLNEGYEPNDRFNREYMAVRIPLNVKDVVEIKDGLGNVYNQFSGLYEMNEQKSYYFDGNIEHKGTYYFYIQLGEGYNVSVTFIAEQEPQPTVTYFVVSGDKRVQMEASEGDFGTEYVGVIELAQGDIAEVKDSDGNVYDNYEENCSGTASVNGTYTFYLKVEYNYSIYVGIEPAEEPVEDDTLTLYYNNVNHWNQIYAYAWSGSNETEDLVSYLGDWPGTQMEAVDGDWYSITVSVNATHVIFNDGGNNQTDDLTIDADTPYFYDGAWYAQDPTIQEPVSEFVTLYFKNNGNWDQVYAYAWSGSNETEDLVSYLGDWPGTQMEAVAGDWYSITVSVNATHVIFNDGSAQTDDLTIDADKPYYRDGAWYATRENEPTIQHTYYIKVNNGEPIAMEYYEGDYGAQYVYTAYAYAAQLKAEDSVVFLDGMGNTYSNYVDTDFDGQVKVDGEYTFFLRLEDGNPIYVASHENSPESFAVYVNDQKIADMSLNEGYETNDRFNREYMAERIPLNVNDQVVIVDEGSLIVYYLFSDLYELNKNEHYDFDGTVQYKGTYNFYIQLGDSYNNSVTFIADQDPEPTVTYFVVSGDKRVQMEVSEGDFGTEYVGVIELAQGDIAEVKDGDGNVYSNYEENCSGTASVNGTYTFYLKVAQNNSIYVAVEPTQDPEPTVTYFVVSEDKRVQMEVREGDFGLEYVGAIELAQGDIAEVKDGDGNVYSNYEENCSGTASVNGTYTFYLKVAQNNSIYVAVEPAEEPVEDDTLTLYYFNNNHWNQVYAYAWSGSKETEDLVSYLGDWPGTQMEAVDGDWYSITVSVNATKVIFNDGSAQTDDLTIDADTPYFYDGAWYAQDPTVQEPVSEFVTLYYYNIDHWNQIYAYAWYGENEDTVSVLGEWPGAQMEAVDGDWYSITVSVKATKVIFNDGSAQTDDLTIDADTPYFYDGTWYAQDPTAEEIVSEFVTLYFKNNKGWDQIYAYAWSGSKETEDLVSYLGEWPGTQMEVDGDWYSVTVSVNATYVIFTDGNKQTDDLTIDHNNLYYDNGWTNGSK